MDTANGARIVGSSMTVSDKIRALNEAGYPRADIARALGKRYQHVRNVLEADKLHPVRERPESSAGDVGVEDPGQQFVGSHRLSVEPGGLVRLPSELLAALQAKPGSIVIAEVQGDGVKLFSSTAAWDRVRALVEQIGIDPKRDLVAELIAERRAEAALDD